MIFTKPVRRKVSAAGPITIDDVRDGAPANWVGPANPAAVMLFDSSGLDWYNATDYQTALFNDAVYKTGTDGGIDFPQGNIPTTYSYATTAGLYLSRAHDTGPWSCLLLFSFLESLATFEFLGRVGPSTADRMGFDSSNENFKITATAEYPSLQRTNAPFKSAVGIRYEPSEPFGTRGKVYADGVQEPQESMYWPTQYNLNTLGYDPTYNFPMRGVIHAFIRWDYEITHQEMLDATANPDSLFAAA